MKPCSEWRLYVIADRSAAGQRSLTDVAAAAVRGGADVIQLRDKTATARQLLDEAQRLLPITQAGGIPLIINDRSDLVQAAGAAGVHLGQDDLPLSHARKLLGNTYVIGQSTHSVDEAQAAQAEGADYIGLGPIFTTPTKPDYQQVGIELISRVVPCARVPVVCIGGIDRTNIRHVIAAGARCVAVVRAICASPDPESATRELKTLLSDIPHHEELRSGASTKPSDARTPES